jgi:hypothetical protein
MGSPRHGRGEPFGVGCVPPVLADSTGPMSPTAGENRCA